jgi:hypothetical protein
MIPPRCSPHPIFCIALAMVSTNLLAAPKPPPTKADVSYGSHRHQLLDIYILAQGAGPFPVVLWFGGLWAPSKGTPDLNHSFPHCAVVAV